MLHLGQADQTVWCCQMDAQQGTHHPVSLELVLSSAAAGSPHWCHTAVSCCDGACRYNFNIVQISLPTASAQIRGRGCVLLSAVACNKCIQTRTRAKQL